MYKCTCKENVMCNICKHMHACHRLFNIIDDSSTRQNDINQLKIEEFFSNYCQAESAKSDKNNVEIVKRKIELFQSQLTRYTLPSKS